MIFRLLVGRLAGALAGVLAMGAVHAADLVYLGTVDRLNPGPGWFNALTGSRAIALAQPVLVAAHANELFIADDLHQALYRHNLVTGDTAELTAVYRQLRGRPGSLFVDRMQEIYVADASGRQVLRFDRDGQLLQRYADPLNLNAPIGICRNPHTGNLFVADALFGHVIEFAAAGLPVAVHGLRKQGEALRGSRRLVGMACDDDRIVTTAALLPEILVFSWSGELQRRISRPETKRPTAVALDEHGRIYISDQFDDRIRIYDENGLIGTFGGRGSGPADFNEITALWLDGATLYVADSGNRRIQYYHTPVGAWE